MKRLIAIIAAFLLVACGGGGTTDPTASAAPFMPDTNILKAIAQCNGTPKTAVVYAGTSDFAELALVPNACVYSTPGASIAELGAVMEQAMAATSKSAIHLIASGEAASIALQYMSASPGHVAVASLWFTPFTPSLDGLKGSIVSIYLNETTQAACAKQAAATPQYVPDGCLIWQDTSFSPAERVAAIGELAL